MSVNHHDAIPKASPLFPPIVNAPFQQFDQQVKDMDDGTHAFQNIDIDGGTIDATTIGASAPAAGSFTTIAASGDLNYGSCLRAYMSHSQSILTTAVDKIEFDAVELDNNDDYDLLNYRFTPSVAGYYMFGVTAPFAASAGAKNIKMYLYKNGAAVSTYSVVSVGTLYNGMTHIDVQQANGKDDYFEVFFDNGDTGTILLAVTTTPTFWAYRMY